jgi:phosphatidylglycerophosphate synthase
VDAARAPGAVGLIRGAALASGPAEGLLLIVPADGGGRPQLSGTTVVAGLPLVRRIALAAARAGFGRVLVHGLSVDGALSGIPAAALDPGRSATTFARHRLVLLPANIVPRPEWLRELLAAPIEPDTVYVDASMAAMIETGRLDGVLAALARCRDAGDLLGALRGRFREAPWPVDRSGRFIVTRRQDLPRAETWLLQGLIKPTEGFMSRHVERRLSLALTRRLVATRITPNAMTLVSVGIGLLGAPCFASARPAVQLAGALLFLIHSILDGCDGELARLKFLESRYGALLDFWGDNLVHVSVFVAMAIGWSVSLGAIWPLAVGGVAVAGTLAAAATLAGRGASHGGREGRPSWAGRLTDALANRDFIYLIVLLAALGKAWWFLVLVSAGTPIFVLLCLSAGRARATV